MIETIDRKKIPALNDIGKIKIQEAEISTLDNGIPVYTISAGFQDLVKIELLFTDASFDPAQPIISSAANRMLSEGSSTHSSQQLAEMIDAYGAFYETEESSDYCSVVLFTLNKYLDETLPVLREIITDAVFPENDLSTFIQNNRQRLIVESEKVNSVSRKKFSEVLFGANHSYGHYVTPADYESLNMDVLQQYHQKNYQSGNCCILVAGKVKPGTAASLNKFFGKDDWKKSKSVSRASAAIQSAKEKIHIIEKKGAVQSAIRIGKVLFNKTHPDFVGMTVLNTALGGYFGSRLMSNIREDKGYTYGIGSALMSMKDAGCFFISTEVGANVTGKAIDEIYKEIARLSTEPVEGNELEMVKNFMTGSFLKGIDGAFQLADRWKGLWLHGLGYDYFERYLTKVRDIQSEELVILAEKYLNSGDFYEVVVGKK